MARKQEPPADRVVCQVGNRVLARIDFAGGRVRKYVLKGMTGAEKMRVAEFFRVNLWPDESRDQVYERLFG